MWRRQIITQKGERLEGARAGGKEEEEEEEEGGGGGGGGGGEGCLVSTYKERY